MRGHSFSLLIKEGSQFFIANQEGVTVFHWKSRRGQSFSLQIKEGSQFFASNQGGVTVFYFKSRRGQSFSQQIKEGSQFFIEYQRRFRISFSKSREGLFTKNYRQKQMILILPTRPLFTVRNCDLNQRGVTVLHCKSRTGHNFSLNIRDSSEFLTANQGGDSVFH